MPIRFPINFRERGCEPCSICMRISLGHDTEDSIGKVGVKIIDYYGCVGTVVCRVCQRNVCNIHSNSKFGVCSDCFSEGKGKDLQEVAEVEVVQENKSNSHGEKGNLNEFIG